MDAAETLLELEAIKQLKYRYWRTLDTKQWDEFATCFTTDATADYGPKLVFTGRDAIVDFMRTAMGPGLISMHHGHHPEITLDGDRATGIWYLQDQVFVPEHSFALMGAALYADRYVRVGDTWLIEHTGYTRTFDATWSTKDTPSLKFTAPGL
jgi:hypothetical protein